MSFTISDDGLNLIKQFEGYRNSSYKDAVGVWTIGYGTTKVNGVAVTSGMTCTIAQATTWLKSDCSKFVTNVNKYNHIYNWSQNELDALTSFAYNIGSIDGLTANGTRTRQQISSKMLEYCHAGGKTLSGLLSRRKKEQTLFNAVTSNSFSSTSSTNDFNQHVHDLQWAVNKDMNAGLTEDGKYGTKTDSIVKKLVIKNGTMGNVCSWVQCRVGVSADGVAGSKTVAAIKAYQKSKGLTADGCAGYNTITSLLRDYGVDC